MPPTKIWITQKLAFATFSLLFSFLHGIIDTVKQAGASDDMGLQLYEPTGDVRTVQASLCIQVQKDQPINLIEHLLHEQPLSDGEIPLVFAPYETITISLTPNNSKGEF